MSPTERRSTSVQVAETPRVWRNVAADRLTATDVFSSWMKLQDEFGEIGPPQSLRHGFFFRGRAPHRTLRETQPVFFIFKADSHIIERRQRLLQFAVAVASPFPL
jgi:hypothetical protein